MNEGHSALLVLALLRARGTLERGPRALRVHHPHAGPGRPRPLRPRPGRRRCSGRERADALRALRSARRRRRAQHDASSRCAARATPTPSRCATARSRARCSPTHAIAAITNGVHAATWAAPPFAALFDRRLPAGGATTARCARPSESRCASSRAAHAEAKTAMIERIARPPACTLDPQALHHRHRPPRDRVQAGRPDPARSRAAAPRSRGAAAGCSSSSPARRTRATRTARLRSSTSAPPRRRWATALRIVFVEELRHDVGRAAHRRRRPLAQHPAPAARSLGHERDEGRGQRRPQPERRSTAGGSRAPSRASPAGRSTSDRRRTTARTADDALPRCSRRRSCRATPSDRDAT